MILIILVIIGILAFNYFNAGPVTEEEKELEAWEQDFDSAWKQMRQAERTMALSGADTSTDMDNVIMQVERIKENLTQFIDRLKDEKLLKKARALEERINKFLRQNY